jgi:hypothetical protein
MSRPEKGLRDFSGYRLSRHALDRYAERFGVDPGAAEAQLRPILARMRRLGKNPENQAIAALGMHGDKILVAIFQDDACLTVLTWPQFEPRLADFGRHKLPRKRGRYLRRIRDTE